MEAVLNRRTPYISGAEWLGRYLLPDRWVIGVAGTHGKTTTTSMIAWILECAGLTPGFLIGGVPGNFGVSARLGQAPFFVIEADEYDTSYFDHQSKFLHYRPQTLVINNLEYDHADIFPDLEAIQTQFHLLMRRVPGNGQAIYPIDDGNVQRVIQMGCWSETRTIGGTGADFGVADASADGGDFHVSVAGKVQGHVKWQLTGTHNTSNALAAIAATRHAGVKPGLACEALSEFKGVSRRMELIHESNSLRVYDDFAHHPSAIQSTLAGLRAKVGNERILAIIEPASYTMRLGTHAQTLGSAACDADHTLWYKPSSVKWNMKQNLSGGAEEVLDSIDQLLERCQELIEQGVMTHVVIMSNSSFGGFHNMLLSRLA